MNDTEKRLAACFSAVFPEMAPDQIVQASAASLANWDSVATVTLLSVVEEEFGISITVDDPAMFDSFGNILAYLQQTVQ